MRDRRSLPRSSCHALRDGEESVSRVREALESLPKRERAVLRTRLGLARRAPVSLAAVGRRLGLSHERVRRIQDEALIALERALILRSDE